MKTKRKTLTDHDRGYQDGYHGGEDRRERETDEYRQGYANGVIAREEAHERMQATCRRFDRLACRG